jgi:hypothetical protein
LQLYWREGEARRRRGKEAEVGVEVEVVSRLYLHEEDRGETVEVL